MPEPPLLAGAVHETAIDSLPVVRESMVGASGAVAVCAHTLPPTTRVHKRTPTAAGINHLGVRSILFMSFLLLLIHRAGCIPTLRSITAWARVGRWLRFASFLVTWLPSLGPFHPGVERNPGAYAPYAAAGGLAYNNATSSPDSRRWLTNSRIHAERQPVIPLYHQIGSTHEKC